MAYLHKECITLDHPYSWSVLTSNTQLAETANIISHISLKSVSQHCSNSPLEEELTPFCWVHFTPSRTILASAQLTKNNLTPRHSVLCEDGFKTTLKMASKSISQHNVHSDWDSIIMNVYCAPSNEEQRQNLLHRAHYLHHALACVHSAIVSYLATKMIYINHTVYISYLHTVF